MNSAEIGRRDAVHRVYSDIAEHPEEGAPFPVGRNLAVGVGYPPELLATLPAGAVEAFSGVSNVSLFAIIESGATVVDLGCGGGLDTLVAARRTGPAGTVHAVDFSEAMLQRARCAIAASGCDNVELHRAEAESLPLPSDSVDVALVNGIFNLNPFRKHIFAEIYRVLHPGGRAFVAELVLRGPLPEAERQDTTNWFT